MPRSSSRSYMRRGSMAVARSSTFSLGDDQKASWPTRRRVRSATVILSEPGTRPGAPPRRGPRGRLTPGGAGAPLGGPRRGLAPRRPADPPELLLHDGAVLDPVT